MAPHLELFFDNNMLFLTPTKPHDPNDHEPPPNDLVFHGWIELYLSSPKKISELKVTFITLESISFGPLKPIEQSHPVELACILIDRETELPEGTHKYDYSFFIPHTMAAHQRSEFGRLWHRLTATTKIPGRFKSQDLETYKEIFAVVNPTPNYTNPFSFTLADFVDTVGIVRVSVRSAHLTVGGIMHVQITIDEPILSQTEIPTIDIILQQRVITQSRKDPQLSHPFPAKYLTLQSIPFTDLQSAALPQGGSQETSSVRGKWTVRLPNDDNCRPSTWEFSDDAIKVAHVIEIRLNLVREGKIQPISIQRPIQLLHCLNTVDSTILPVYSEIDPKPPQPLKFCSARANSWDQCVCGYHLERLIEIDALLDKPEVHLDDHLSPPEPKRLG